jgi:hypothetical protein
MKQEDKELLLKDLCARSPYGVKIFVNDNVEILEGVHMLDKVAWYDGWCASDIEEVKPYLFPLSSMTKEQWDNGSRVNLTEFTFDSLECGCFTIASYTCENDLPDLLEFINWLIENHFDIYGLIPKGLAIDATGLNIY